MKISVAYTNGRQVNYEPVKWEVEDGLLWLTPRSPRDPTFCIPLANVYVWTVSK